MAVEVAQAVAEAAEASKNIINNKIHGWVTVYLIDKYL